VGRDLKDPKIIAWLGLEGTIRIVEVQSPKTGWVGRSLAGHRPME